MTKINKEIIASDERYDMETSLLIAKQFVSSFRNENPDIQELEFIYCTDDGFKSITYNIDKNILEAPFPKCGKYSCQCNMLVIEKRVKPIKLVFKNQSPIRGILPFIR